MSFKKIIVRLFFGLLATSVCHPATAGLTLGFSADSGASFLDSFDVLTGDSVTIGVYINEDADDDILDTVGFFGFGLTAVAAPTTFGAISAAAIDPLYDFNTIDEFTGSTIDWEAAIFLNDIPIGQSIFLGSFQFDTTADGSTVFTFADLLPGTGSANTGWLDGFGNELDQLIFGAGATNTYQLTITSTTIPEPGSFAFCVVGMLIAGTRRRRTLVQHEMMCAHRIMRD